MGAERDDSANRVGTEPGLGKSSGATAAAAATTEDDAPPPVDFDALHAALGDPLDYQELSSGPALEQGTDELLDSMEPAVEVARGSSGGISESSGRSSATYSSARPRTIPPTRAPAEDPNAPAVIVASDTDTVPSAPPHMTVPLAPTPHGPAFGGALPSPPMGRPPGSNPQLAIGAGSGPHGAAQVHPGSGPHAAASDRAPGYPHTPHPFSPPQQRGNVQMTMRMPDRPVNLNPRRGKTATVVVRPRGPSAKQKLAAFMAMLLLVTVCGVAVIMWRKPRLLGLDPGTSPSASASMGVGPSAAGATGATSTSVAPNAVPSTSGSGSAPAASSAGGVAVTPVKKVPKPAPPPPHPAASSAPLLR